MMASLTAIDALDIRVLMNDQLDNIASSRNAEVTSGGPFSHVPLRKLDAAESQERGNAKAELHLPSSCCGAHGLSLMIVRRYTLCAPLRVADHGRRRQRRVKPTPCSLTLAPKAICGSRTSNVSSWRRKLVVSRGFISRIGTAITQVRLPSLWWHGDTELRHRWPRESHQFNQYSPSEPERSRES